MDPLAHYPYGLRVAILVILFTGAAAVDYWIRREKATRWREYSFLLFAAATGALFGVGCDLVTSHLSPAYFVWGKGLTPGAGFIGRVVELGAKAGSFAGLVAGGCYLLANNPRPGRPAAPYRELFRNMLKPIAAALGLALVAGLGGWILVKPSPHIETYGVMTTEEAVRFLRVWLIHCGLYLGLAVGTVWAVRAIQRARKRLREK